MQRECGDAATTMVEGEAAEMDDFLQFVSMWGCRGGFDVGYKGDALHGT